MIGSGCLFVDTLRCLKTSYPIILFVEDRINSESFLFGKYEDSISVILHVMQQACALLQTFLNHCCMHSTGFYWNVSNFFLSSSRPSWTQWRLETEIFFFCASLLFSSMGHFESFLMASELISWSLSYWRRSFRYFEAFKHFPPDEQSFCWRSFALKFQIFRRLRTAKWIF